MAFKEKQLRCKNSLYRVFIIVRGMNTSWIPLITLCYIPFYFGVYLFDDISLCLNFQRVFCWWSLWYYMYFLISCVINFNTFFRVYPVFAWPTNVILVNVSDITSVSYFQDNFILIRVWYVTGWPLSMNVFHTPMYCMYPFGQKQDISESVRTY